MIDKGMLYRKGFQGGGADMGGVADSQGNTGPGTGGLGDRGGGRSNRDRGMGIHGKTSTIGKTTTAQQDANQRAQVRAGRVRGLEKFIDRPTLGFTDAARINLFNPRNIFSGIMGLINPALGLATRGLGYLGDKFQGLRGYNPDGTPRTQEEYEAAMRDKQIQSRIDNIMNRQTLGKSFSQTNLDSLLGMTDMYGDRFSPSTAQNVLTGRDLKGFTPSRMGIMNPDLVTPTNLNDYLGYRDREYIESTPSANPEDYDFTGFEDAMAFNPGSIKDRALKQQFNIYNATGIVTPNMQKLMQEDIEQNQKKGTPLSLPAEAYNLIT